MAAQTDDFGTRVLPYLDMMREFLRGSVPPEEFVVRYQERYLKDPTMWPDDYFEELDSVFATGDEMVLDDEERALSEFHVSPADLAARVTRAVEVLTALRER